MGGKQTRANTLKTDQDLLTTTDGHCWTILPITNSIPLFFLNHGSFLYIPPYKQNICHDSVMVTSPFPSLMTSATLTCMTSKWVLAIPLLLCENSELFVSCLFSQVPTSYVWKPHFIENNRMESCGNRRAEHWEVSSEVIKSLDVGWQWEELADAEAFLELSFPKLYFTRVRETQTRAIGENCTLHHRRYRIKLADAAYWPRSRMSQGNL